MKHEYQTKDQWLKLRHKNINSTESCALFGLSPYTTAFELYYTKRESEPVQIEENFRMKCGTVLEDAIATLALDELRCEGIPFKDYWTLPAARMGSSFDYMITSGDYEGWLLECKNVDYLQYMDKWTDSEAPVHIECQVQHQMHVADAPGCIIAALVGGNDLKLIVRPRDKRFGKALEEKVMQFWHNFDNCIEPDPDFERDADLIKKLYGDADKNKAIDLSDDSDIMDMLQQYEDINAQLELLEEKKKEIQARVFMQAGDAGKITCGNYSVSMTMTQPSEGRLVTPDMVGTRIGGRKGFRNFRLTTRKTK